MGACMSVRIERAKGRKLLNLLHAPSPSARATSLLAVPRSRGEVWSDKRCVPEDSSTAELLRCDIVISASCACGKKQINASSTSLAPYLQNDPMRRRKVLTEGWALAVGRGGAEQRRRDGRQQGGEGGEHRHSKGAELRGGVGTWAPQL